MAEINTGGPAFPFGVQRDLAVNHHPVGNYTWQQYGISVRDYFAAKAMAVLMLNDQSSMRQDAELAYSMADEMLAARAK